MKTDEIVKRQLAARLERLKARAASLAAEIVMVERYLADAEKASAFLPQLKLRKNSVAKWSIQGQVRRVLTETQAPVRAQHLFDTLKKYEAGLKSSTFRSHIKRMVDAGIIKREGSRGHYQLVERPNEEPIDTREPSYPKRRIKVPIFYR